MGVKKINVPFATPIPILIENTFTMLKYSSFSRGCKVYKDMWIPIIGDGLLMIEKNIIKMIRMSLQLYGMTVFQKRL